MIRIELLSKENFGENSLDTYQRRQDVKKVYRKVNGAYKLVECPYTEDWDLARKRQVAGTISSDDYITYLAFDEESVVGFIGLKKSLTDGYMILDMMHVSASVRGQGIGRRLFELGKETARKSRAKALYISACSSEETIAFYKAMGAVIIDSPIKEIADDEPYDLQMVCALEMHVNGKSYQIIKLLGHGKGGYSYLATDGTKEYVLKQIHHEPCDYYQFGNKIESEIGDYGRLQEIGIPMPRLLEVDRENERILKEYIKGDTIFDYVLRDAMKPDYIEQMKNMCVSLYAVHTNIDYFPTNFVVQDEKLYYIDYECNDYMDEWNFENWGIKYWSKTKEFLDYVNKEQTI